MTRPLTSDQADGLRRMFSHRRTRFVPVVSNPYIAFGGVLLERLTTAWGERGATSLVVDAAERAGEAGEMAMVDLGQCVETLSPKVSYLSARGLPIRFVDAQGSTASLLQALVDAAPRCDTVFVHASAPELARLFSARRGAASLAMSAGGAEPPCPIVLADDRPQSVTHAYGAMKLLAQRAQLVVFDLVVGAAAHSPRVDRIVASISACADGYFGGVVRTAVRIDPAVEATEPPNAELRALVSTRLDRGAPRGDAPRMPLMPPPHTSLPTSNRPHGHAFP